MRVRMLVAGAAAAAMALAAAPVSAQSPDAERGGLRLAEPVEATLDAGLADATGTQLVSITLTQAPVATGGKAQKPKVAAQQRSVERAIANADADAKVVARANTALNAVFAEVDASALRALAADPNVVSIKPVGTYELDLTETVPYIGATAVQNKGFTGAGVKVAVLDSGVDYTHAAMGGAGTAEAYAAAYGTGPADPKNTTRDGLFPTAKVYEGYDFVGEVWPNGPLVPDPDPIDAPPTPPTAGGHGTHVADIIAGIKGVAPGAQILAVKVCSAVSTACSGVALIQGIDYALDPNGDANLADRVDIINMSLGSPYGQPFDDDLSQAVENATHAGVLTVASAGNSSDKPYVTGSPAAAPSALSVAQTEVPSATLPLLEVLTPASIAGTIPAVFQPWSVPPSGVIEASVVYDATNAGTRLGCSNSSGASPWVGTPLAGKIVLVDRGTCSFSLKIANVAAAGGVVGIIGLVAPGDPFGGGFGGGVQTIPGYMISQADSTKIKSGLTSGVTMKVDPAKTAPLVGTVVGSSSRGPTMGSNAIKPEIGAPGASVSAVSSSGTGTEAFGGTSGAAPMVAGSAALLKQAYPARSPLELKSVLMNTGERTVYNKAAALGGPLAPISRIGGGEVRVDRALDTSAAAWDAGAPSGSLSFGFVDASKKTQVLKKFVTVSNYGKNDATYTITPTFRYANDAALGALTFNHPPTVKVKAGRTATFPLTVLLDGTKLPDWTGDTGALGADPTWLDLHELDGYLELTSGTSTVHLAWHVLPRKSGDVEVGAGTLTNWGVGTTDVEQYALLGTSPDLPEGGAGEQNPTPDLRYAGVRTFSGTGICPANTPIVVFGVNLWERATHSIAPAQVRIDLDTDRDGRPDFQVRNADFTLNQITDGRVLTWVVNLRTGAASAFFFADHDSNSGNLGLTICGSQLADATRPAGLGGPLPVPSVGQLVDVDVTVLDNYFQGVVTDRIDDRVMAFADERYGASFEGSLAPGATVPNTLVDAGANGATELGALLLFQGGAPADNEAAVLLAP